MNHDPSEYIRGLQQILISDKKKIAFLFGAGTSLARKSKKTPVIPAITQMTTQVVKKISTIEKFKLAINEIQSEILATNSSFNIETLLSNLEKKKDIIGSGTLNNLNQDDIIKFIKDVKQEIKNIISIHDKIFKDNLFKELPHSDFSEWIIRADRKYPIEIFTTNYDYFIELGLESNNIPYYDGFTGSFQPFFNSDSIEDLSLLPKQTKLWKIHGSLGWHLDEKNKKVLRKDSDAHEMLIYPSVTKYSESKKLPYTAIIDRLTNFLKQPDTVLITCGYSFSDEHINERIFSALQTSSTSHVIALYFDKNNDEGKITHLLTEESNLAKIAKTNQKLSIYGCKSAVIGCQFGDWKLKRNIDDQELINSFLVNNNGDKKNDEWTGEGELILTDFSKFVLFLKSMIFQNHLGIDKNAE